MNSPYKKALIIASIILLLMISFYEYNRITSCQLREAIMDEDISRVSEIIDRPFSKLAVNTSCKSILRSLFPSDSGDSYLNGEFAPSFPLQWAASKSQPETIELLLDAGADINRKTEYTETALGCVFGEDMRDTNLECVKILIDNGAKVNAADGNYLTDAASLFPYVEADKVDYSEWTFDKKLAKDSVEIYKIIERNIVGELEENEAENDLYDAVCSNNYLMVKYLLSSNKPIDLNRRDDFSDGRTVLFCLGITVCDEETVKIAELLIEEGADKSIKNDEGKTAYDAACQEKYKAISKELKKILKP